MLLGVHRPMRNRALWCPRTKKSDLTREGRREAQGVCLGGMLPLPHVPSRGHGLRPRLPHWHVPQDLPASGLSPQAGAGGPPQFGTGLHLSGLCGRAALHHEVRTT